METHFEKFSVANLKEVGEKRAHPPHINVLFFEIGGKT